MTGKSELIITTGPTSEIGSLAQNDLSMGVLFSLYGLVADLAV